MPDKGDPINTNHMITGNGSCTSFDDSVCLQGLAVLFYSKRNKEINKQLTRHEAQEN